MESFMETLIKDTDKLENKSILKQILNKLSYEEIKYFKKRIREIKKEYMYKSDIHGIYHSEKVALNAYLIGLDQKLDQVDMEILLDAAIYHDIGRINDFEDSFHGLASANMIEEVVNTDIYSDSNNLKILKAIIDYHSQNDRKLRINFENYEIDEEHYERYEILAKILKDADALDRKRFVDKSNAALNSIFLRFNITHELIPLAVEMNKEYYRLMEINNFDITELECINGDCLHSVGFDFFRLKSILTKGILSYKKMQSENLRFPKNFDGGNYLHWISVVPTSLIDKNGEAFKNFIRSGITFLCNNQKLYKPLDYNRRAEAICKGLPYDKSNYIDELYAFYEIPANDIISIFIVKDFANKDIRNIMFLYNTLHYGTLKEKIVYILSNIKYNLTERDNILFKWLNAYKKETDFYENSDFETRRYISVEMPKKLNPILIKINEIVSKLIYNYYVMNLGKNKGDIITVADVIKYELNTNGFSFDLINGDEELVFILNDSREKKLTYKS